MGHHVYLKMKKENILVETINISGGEKNAPDFEFYFIYKVFLLFLSVSSFEKRKLLKVVQGVPFLFVPLQTRMTQRLKIINAICKRDRTALGKTILLMKFHLSILIIKVTTAILVKGDSISKQT